VAARNAEIANLYGLDCEVDLLTSHPRRSHDVDVEWADIDLGFCFHRTADLRPQIWKMQVVDKNCFIERFEDDNFDADDPHVPLQDPQAYATLKSLGGNRPRSANRSRR
jgi:hypothetical protein